MRYLFSIYGPFAIGSYGVCIALGILAAYAAHALRRASRVDISLEKAVDLCVILALSGLVGGKIMSIIELGWRGTLGGFVSWFDALFSGFSLLGAIIGGIIGGFFAARLYALSPLMLFDYELLYGPLIEAIGRWGCFFSGCCYGVPVASDAWYAITYTDPYSLAPLGCPLFPAQILTSVVSLILFGVLRFGVLPRFRQGSGILGSLSLCGMALMRWGLDFVRADRGEIIAWGCTQYQFVALAIAAGALLFLRYCVRTAVIASEAEAIETNNQNSSSRRGV